MMTGIDTAWGEITLVLFTTLAPSGVVAFIVMGLTLLRGDLSSEERRRINQFLSIPLVTAMVGLVASATHLGNPANALYVFLGVGRSPLSTEVFCAVVFLALAGVYWLYSFSVHPNERLRRWWIALAMIAGVVFVTSVSLAYAADTIVSWSTPSVPIALWLNSLVGGPVLALVGLGAARWSPSAGIFGRALMTVSCLALVLNLAVYGIQAFELPAIENAFLTAADLVPHYGGMVIAFALLAAAGIGLDARILFGRRGEGPRSLTIPRAVAASALVLAGIFIMRFAFYMMHMTEGLGV
ncbi:MAG: DmsC/YnfH family molybdoenzyme membrane anchor subunit [Gordonibacter sp.]